MGIASIRDVPDDFELTEIQRRAATCVQTGEPWFSDDLGKELGGLKYPIYFMDFETVNPAIPRFAGMRPYDQLPFQWSVHVLREPGAEPEHYEFLATDTTILGASSSLRYALSWARVEASSCTAPSSRSGFRSLRRGCLSSRGASRKSSAVCGTCSLWSGTMCTIRSLQGHTQLRMCFLRSCRR